MKILAFKIRIQFNIFCCFSLYHRSYHFVPIKIKIFCMRKVFEALLPGLGKDIPIVSCVEARGSLVPVSETNRNWTMVANNLTSQEWLSWKGIPYSSDMEQYRKLKLNYSSVRDMNSNAACLLWQHVMVDGVWCCANLEIFCWQSLRKMLRILLNVKCELEFRKMAWYVTLRCCISCQNYST